MSDYNEFAKDLRKEGDERTKRKIAKKLKGMKIFSNSFISELVELDIRTIERLKGND